MSFSNRDRSRSWKPAKRDIKVKNYLSMNETSKLHPHLRYLFLSQAMPCSFNFHFIFDLFKFHFRDAGHGKVICHLLRFAAACS